MKKTSEDALVEIPEEIKVCGIGDIADSSKISVKAGEYNVLVVKIDNRFYAIENRCSKDGEKLSDGTIDTETASVKCSFHDGSFMLQTGLHSGSELHPPVRVFLGYVKGESYFIDPEPKEIPFVEGINL